MSTTNQTNDVFDLEDGQKPAMPTSINVLTILTIIGSSIFAIMGLWTYFTIEKSYKTMLENRDKLAEAPAWAKKLMSPEMIENARKQMENKLPIMLLTLVGCALCLYGAIEMRKLKKQGFILWAAGEFLPIVGGAIFVGVGAFSGLGLFAFLFPVLFLIMYAVNRKHLVY